MDSEDIGRIVIDKGFFALHADERSYLLYDIQLWLYTNAYPDTTEEDYLSAYKKDNSAGR